MLKLYNTLAREIEDFILLRDDVSLYTCGPTVYHYAHIGNLRNVIFNDTLDRVLKASGYQVHRVMNITDVGHLVGDADEGEDKLEKGAQREGKTVWEIAQFYTDAFFRHCAALNVATPDETIKATDAIPSQIELVQTLLDKGYAYISEQAIYFDVTKFKDYGKLSGQKLDEKETGARADVVVDSHKNHPYDFALWFFTVGHFADHEMRWQTPWGEGFPGWHLECSAIIHQALEEPIDIHTGGVDHIGTHHTNEMAQSEAAFGQPLARYWLHNEFLQQNDEKMSKSSGSTITLDDITTKGYDPLALRLFYLQSHYRSHANFTWENIHAAQSRLDDFRAWADLRHQPSADTMPEELNLLFKTTRDEILNALQQDLNTPAALTSLSKLVNYMADIAIPSVEGKHTDGMLAFLDKVLGLSLANRPDITDDQKELIEKREAARKAQDWSKSDEVREQLKKQGIGIRDTANGPVWYRENVV